ncbi:MAG TPA: HIT family protein [Candidatus Udaeobacter sp.]|nr:HIT family protein [Candidatus Udaeobacter sp.]
MDCLFCKIINKEIPNYTVWEDENVLAFLDIHPCAKGHTVVVPKKHAATLWDMRTEEFDLMAHSLRAAAGRVQARLKPDGMNIGINNDKAAGQAVGHVHWHIIPRWQGDGGGSMHSIIRKTDLEDVKEVAKLFI